MLSPFFYFTLYFCFFFFLILFLAPSLSELVLLCFFHFLLLWFFDSFAPSLLSLLSLRRSLPLRFGVADAKETFHFFASATPKRRREGSRSEGAKEPKRKHFVKAEAKSRDDAKPQLYRNKRKKK
uniref:Transmembrane protein n=1 Tax=Pediastrum duplex TaxID=3105 RepID=A0A1W6F7N6_PEDDU|nr:hypothetical protein [Pediastrum duplex]ARK36694.1 hypothetical protein [Pediastrum duplex]